MRDSCEADSDQIEGEKARVFILLLLAQGYRSAREGGGRGEGEESGSHPYASGARTLPLAL